MEEAATCILLVLAFVQSHGLTKGGDALAPKEAPEAQMNVQERYNLWLQAFECDETWKAKNSKPDKVKGCKTYIDKEYCTKDGGYGKKWKNKWGTFENYADDRGRTAKVCPQCGCLRDIPANGSSSAVDVTPFVKNYYQRLDSLTQQCQAKFHQFNNTKDKFEQDLRGFKDENKRLQKELENCQQNYINANNIDGYGSIQSGSILKMGYSSSSTYTETKIKFGRKIAYIKDHTAEKAVREHYWEKVEKAEKANKEIGDSYWCTHEGHVRMPAYWWMWSKGDKVEIVSIEFEEKYKGAQFELIASDICTKNPSETNSPPLKGNVTVLISGTQADISGVDLENERAYRCYGLRITKLAFHKKDQHGNYLHFASMNNFHFFFRDRHCQGKDCSGNGRCYDQAIGYKCVCHKRFTGKDCDVKSLIGTGVTCLIKENWRYYGSDTVKLYKIKSVAKCQEQCFKRYPDCVGFTYEGENNYCFMKSKLANGKEDKLGKVSSGECYPNQAHQCDETWKAKNSRADKVKGCKTYIDEEYCTKDGGYGKKWKDKWGTFEEWADDRGRTAKVCPQCGCLTASRPEAWKDAKRLHDNFGGTRTESKTRNILEILANRTVAERQDIENIYNIKL